MALFFLTKSQSSAQNYNTGTTTFLTIHSKRLKSKKNKKKRCNSEDFILLIFYDISIRPYPTNQPTNQPSNLPTTYISNIRILFGKIKTGRPKSIMKSHFYEKLMQFHFKTNEKPSHQKKKERIIIITIRKESLCEIWIHPKFLCQFLFCFYPFATFYRFLPFLCLFFFRSF